MIPLSIFILGAAFGFAIRQLIEEFQSISRTRESQYYRQLFRLALDRLELATSPEVAAVRDPKSRADYAASERGGWQWGRARRVDRAQLAR